MSALPTFVSVVEAACEFARLLGGEVSGELNHARHICAASEELSGVLLESHGETEILLKLSHARNSSNVSGTDKIRNEDDLFGRERSRGSFNLEREATDSGSLNLDTLRTQHRQVRHLSRSVREHSHESVTVEQERDDQRVVESDPGKIDVGLVDPLRLRSENLTSPVTTSESVELQS